MRNLDANGFRVVREQFNPQSYYQQYPRVAGQYDGAYSPFELNGKQAEALGAIANFTRANRINLIFVNLPLSQDYLDTTRLAYEQQFQFYIQGQSRLYGFGVIDLLTQWTGPGGDRFFADPSHLNQGGAAAVAQQLATHALIPWQILIGLQP
jgi:hypothetical protein